MGHGRYCWGNECAKLHVRRHLLIRPPLDRLSDEVSVYLAVNVLVVVQGLHHAFLLSTAVEPAFPSTMNEAVPTERDEAGAATPL